MDNGLQQLNHTCDLGQKVKLRSGEEGKAKVDQEMNDMKRDWEKMNEDISACSAKLDSQLVKWATYEEIRTSLEKWLISVEAELKEGVAPKAEKKAQLEKLKVCVYSHFGVFILGLFDTVCGVYFYFCVDMPFFFFSRNEFAGKQRQIVRNL